MLWKVADTAPPAARASCGCVRECNASCALDAAFFLRRSRQQCSIAPSKTISTRLPTTDVTITMIFSVGIRLLTDDGGGGSKVPAGFVGMSSLRAGVGLGTGVVVRTATAGVVVTLRSSSIKAKVHPNSGRSDKLVGIVAMPMLRSAKYTESGNRFHVLSRVLNHMTCHVACTINIQ